MKEEQVSAQWKEKAKKIEKMFSEFLNKRKAANLSPLSRSLMKMIWGIVKDEKDFTEEELDEMLKEYFKAEMQILALPLLRELM